MGILWIFLAVVLLVLAWTIYLLQFILNNTQNHGVDLCLFRSETFALNESTKRRDYNARHRDGEIRRSLTKYHHDQDQKIHGIAKKLATIEFDINKKLDDIRNCIGKIKNDGVETKDGVLQIRKNLTASGKILAELQSILDKAKKRS